MNHKGTKIIETERLVLRKFKLSDGEAMYKNWANDPEVTKFLTWPPHNSVEVTKDILKSWCDSYKNKKYYQWAIVLKDNGEEPIGSIGAVSQDENIDMIHIGYCMGKKWWKKGIMSEALSAVIDYFINDIAANRIESRHDPRNPNSEKVMMKCGLKYEGTMKKADRNNQGICDCSVYGLIAENYTKYIIMGT